MAPVVEVAALGDLPPEADPVWREWLSAEEFAYCAGRLRVSEHLVARILAKRAVAGALGWRGPIPWRELTVVRDEAGAPSVRLAGSLERWRTERELPVPLVSLTHAGGYAAALAWLPASDGVRLEAAL